MAKKVEVFNITREKVLLREAEVAGNLLARMKGLLGRKELPRGCGIIIRPCNSIHTIGMRFSLDVAFVGRDGRVLKVMENMPPGRLSPMVRGSAYVIEAGSGEFEKAGLAPGDELRLSD